jgi:hypothetical protein
MRAGAPRSWSTAHVSKPNSPGTLWTACLTVALIVATGVTACGGGGDAQTPAVTKSSSTAPPASNISTGQLPGPPAAAVDGWYVGTIKIGGTNYYGEAIVTVDGLMRLYLGGAYSDDGTLQITRPTTSALFVGTLDMSAGAASGSGVVIGLGCGAAPQFNAFCAGDSAAIHFVVNAGKLRGEIQEAGSDAAAPWTLELGWWPNDYTLPATLDGLMGQVKEKVAEFAHDDTVINIDSSGKLFFQSPQSGCVGNGTLAPHLDGHFGVYDVSLTIANCTAPYSYLNGQLDGLATTSPSSYWDYDDNLIMWVSSPAGAVKPVGLRFLAN